MSSLLGFSLPRIKPRPAKVMPATPNPDLLYDQIVEQAGLLVLIGPRLLETLGKWATLLCDAATATPDTVTGDVHPDQLRTIHLFHLLLREAPETLPRIESAIAAELLAARGRRGHIATMPTRPAMRRHHAGAREDD